MRNAGLTRFTLAGVLATLLMLSGCVRQTSVAGAARRVADGVVTVRARIKGGSPFSGAQYEERLGCGTVFAKGRLLTNYHVVEGATEVYVTPQAGEEVPAKIVKRRSDKDLAVLSAPISVSLLSLGDSDNLEIGQAVFVVGKPFRVGTNYTVTSGIISSLPVHLPKGYPKLIQTDAVINPGNSGGPLCTFDGQVVGITTAYLSSGENVRGIGFAIPINESRLLIQ